MLCAVRAAIHTGKEAEGERRQRSDQGTSQGLLLRRKQTNNKDSGCALCVCGTDSTEEEEEEEGKEGRTTQHSLKKRKTVCFVRRLVAHDHSLAGRNADTHKSGPDFGSGLHHAKQP